MESQDAILGIDEPALVRYRASDVCDVTVVAEARKWFSADRNRHRHGGLILGSARTVDATRNAWRRPPSSRRSQAAAL
jgi:hypothetical protein